MKSGGEKHSDEGAQGGNVFDLDRLRQLIELMESHDLTEINLRQGSEKVQLRRGAEQVFAAPAPTVAAPQPVAPSPAASAVAAGPVADGANIVTIKAPMVGTFYARPNPQSETFVKVGQRISADTVICIIEAMKVFNEIPAEISGQVVSVLADDQQAVDFGRPLFKVDTSA
ncbi:MAG TPA: acetyl-CoA carboxylase biotin carboxyl carrier protein [Planctomycetaceae bacterium]|nr:acetyl-CoA carboxylase biotin carboxyl carrier protein [Planctomycetaceae bacterium]